MNYQGINAMGSANKMNGWMLRLLNYRRGRVGWGRVGLLNPNVARLLHADGPLDLVVRRWELVVGGHSVRLRFRLARELDVVQLRGVREHGGRDDVCRVEMESVVRV